MDKEQILKISKHFGIPKEEITKALGEIGLQYENDKFLKLKNKFLTQSNDKLQNKFLKEWLDTCINFEEVEEIFIYAKGVDEEILVIKHWLNFCKTVKHAREIFMSSPKDKLLLSDILRVWINLSNNLEDVREANKYTEKGSEENKIAIKKIIKFY